MADVAVSTEALVNDLLSLTNSARQRMSEGPFGNPVLAIALAIFRKIDQG